jgi:hypothetical protein
MNFVRAGIERAGLAAAEMIVVSADDNGFVGVRTFAFEDGDDIFGVDALG